MVTGRLPGAATTLANMGARSRQHSARRLALRARRGGTSRLRGQTRAGRRHQRGRAAARDRWRVLCFSNRLKEATRALPSSSITTSVFTLDHARAATRHARRLLAPLGRRQASTPRAPPLTGLGSATEPTSRSDLATDIDDGSLPESRPFLAAPNSFGANRGPAQAPTTIRDPVSQLPRVAYPRPRVAATPCRSYPVWHTRDPVSPVTTPCRATPCCSYLCSALLSD